MPMPNPLSNPFSQAPGSLPQPVPGAANALSGVPASAGPMPPSALGRTLPPQTPAARAPAAGPPAAAPTMSAEEQAALAMSPEEVAALATPVQGDSTPSNPWSAKGGPWGQVFNRLKTAAFIRGNKEGGLEIKRGKSWEPASEDEKSAYESVNRLIKTGATLGGATAGGASPIPGGGYAGAAGGSVIGDSLVRLLDHARGIEDKNQSGEIVRQVKNVAEGLITEVGGKVAGKTVEGILGAGGSQWAPAALQGTQEGTEAVAAAAGRGAASKPEMLTGTDTPQGQQLARVGQSIHDGSNPNATPDQQNYLRDLQTQSEKSAMDSLNAFRDEHPQAFGVPKEVPTRALKESKGTEMRGATLGAESGTRISSASETAARSKEPVTPKDYLDFWFSQVQKHIGNLKGKVLDIAGDAQMEDPEQVLSAMQDRLGRVLNPDGSINTKRLGRASQATVELANHYEEFRSKVARNKGALGTETNQLLDRPRPVFDNPESPASTHVQDPLATTEKTPATFAPALGVGDQLTLPGTIPTTADLPMTQVSPEKNGVSLGDQTRTNTGVQDALAGQTFVPPAMSESQRNLPPTVGGKAQAGATVRDLDSLVDDFQKLAKFQAKNRELHPDWEMFGELSHDLAIMRNNAMAKAATKAGDPSLAAQLFSVNRRFSQNVDLNRTVSKLISKDPKGYAETMMKNLSDEEFQKFSNFLPENQRQNLFNGVLDHIIESNRNPALKDFSGQMEMKPNDLRKMVDSPQYRDKIEFLLGDEKFQKFSKLVTELQRLDAVHYMPGEVAGSPLMNKIGKEMVALGTKSKFVGMASVAKKLFSGKPEIYDYFAHLEATNPGVGLPPSIMAAKAASQNRAAIPGAASFMGQIGSNSAASALMGPQGPSGQ